jgi:hypothetical protein
VTVHGLTEEIGDGRVIAIDRAMGLVTVGAGKNVICLIISQVRVFQPSPVRRCRYGVFIFVPQTVPEFILYTPTSGLHHSINRPAARDGAMIITCRIAGT